jgi:hypothetical protein
MTYMGNTTEKAGVVLYEANVNFFRNANTTKQITIDIGNSGTSDAIINAVYVGTSPTAMGTKVYDATTSSIVAGNAPVSFTINYDWGTSTQHYFKVVPSTGNPLTFNEKSPSS